MLVRYQNIHIWLWYAWIIFAGLVQKNLVGQKIITSPPMCECMERELKGDAKAEFI